MSDAFRLLSANLYANLAVHHVRSDVINRIHAALCHMPYAKMIPSGRLQVANAPTQLFCCFYMKIIAFLTLHQSHSLYGVFYFPFSVWLTTFDLQTDGNIRMVYLTLAVDRCFSLSLNQ